MPKVNIDVLEPAFTHPMQSLEGNKPAIYQGGNSLGFLHYNYSHTERDQDLSIHGLILNNPESTSLFSGDTLFNYSPGRWFARFGILECRVNKDDEAALLQNWRESPELSLKRLIETAAREGFNNFDLPVRMQTGFVGFQNADQALSELATRGGFRRVNHLTNTHMKHFDLATLVTHLKLNLKA